MRHVGDLPTHDQARRFADYLLLRDVKVNIDQEDGHWAIWAVEEDQTQQVKQELDRFRENPDDDEYRGHGSTAQRRRKEEEQAHREFRRNQVDVRTRWGRGGAAAIKAGPITLSLIVLSIVVTLMTDFGDKPNKIFQLVTFESLTPLGGDRYLRHYLEGILSGEIWRLFTPIFLHFDMLHILFNMLWLNQLGAQIEARLGKWKYLLLVLVIAGLSNSAEYFWSEYQHPNQLSISGGMSGVVYGLFGFIWMKARYEPQERYLMTQQVVMLMILWLFLCMSGYVGRIANAAHVIGLVTGVIAGYARTFFKRYLS